VANSIDGVIDQFYAMGMPPLPDGYLAVDAGRFTRYGPQKKAWYKVFSYRAKNGKDYYTGTFGYKGAGPYKVESDWSDVDQAERERYLAAQAEAAVRDEAKRVQRAAAAATRAGVQWRMASKTGASDYITRKQVKAESCRFDNDDVLLVPAMRYDHVPATMVGLQKILHDGQKRFNAGMEKFGAACRLGKQPVDGDTLYIVEGYATGASVRMALDYAASVFVAFDAGNLLPVARILRATYPSSQIVFCADNDHETDGNPGKNKALAAADSIGNAHIVLPEFRDGYMAKLTDFNDLHVTDGIEAVRTQLVTINYCFASGHADPFIGDAGDRRFSVVDLPQTPSEGEPTTEPKDNNYTIAVLLEQFALVYGKTDVWDNIHRTLMKQAGFSATVGKSLAAEWRNHPQRRTISPDALPKLKRGRAAGGGAGGDRLAHMLERFTLLYGTVTVWDNESHMVMSLAALTAAFGSDAVKFWQESPLRRLVDADKLVFDPTQSCNPETHINMFDGYPLKPVGDPSKCAAILDLLAELCSHERDNASDVFTWLLRWIAYPLQHPGAKMQSAVLMFGEKQGTGKSLFWEGVVEALYGDYGTTAGQHQLDSQFTEWRSCKTFVVFEEVLSRSERYNFIGTIKHMITGRTQRINPKGLPEREEANHLNSVFLSNEPQPIPLELEDRRFMVVEARNKLTEELKRAVLAEIANGGLAAFYQYLMKFDLADFEPGTPVLRTVAREKIVNFGLPSHEAFFREWQSEELRAPKQSLFVPFCSCRVCDLFEVYRHWCNKTGERLITQTKFSELMANRVTKARAYVLIGSTKVQQRVFIVNPPEPSIAYGLSVSEQCEKFQSIADIDV